MSTTPTPEDHKMAQFTAVNQVKQEDNDDAVVLKTPSKRKIHISGGTLKKPKSEVDTPKSARKESALNKMSKGKIPETMDELAEEDRMLIEWKERGEPYSKINLEWKRITGNMPGKSTLSNRYIRLKAALSAISSEHVPQMVSSEAAVTQQIEAEVKDLWNKKWARVSKHMEDAGVESYPAATIEKHWKKLQASGAYVPTHAANDTPHGIASDEIEE